MALSQGTLVSGSVNANVHAIGAADKPALNGTVTANNIQMSGKQIAQPVHVQEIKLNLTPTEIRSNPFNVVSGGTTLNSQLTIRNYMSPSAIVDTTLRAPNAQLPAICEFARTALIV